MNKILLAAMIEGEECTGCSKCTEVCPTNAIIGEVKYIHIILRDRCIGCSLCIELCPVNCIRLYDSFGLSSCNDFIPRKNILSNIK